MMQKSIDLKDRKILRSIELHPDLKSDAVKRMLNELCADAVKRARTQKVVVIIATD